MIRWPEKINIALTKLGVSYSYGDDDYSPDLLEIEKEDPRFYATWGRPQIAYHEPYWTPPMFENKYACYFLDVDVFTPELARNASRLAFTPLLDQAAMDRLGGSS